MTGPSVQPVILSGGAGSRLWPLSTARRPKQFMSLAGERTLLQMAALRVPGEGGFEAPVFVAGMAHEIELRRQIDALGIDTPTVILEPCGRNTAAAIALAALSASPEAMLLVMPSDHMIPNVAAFHSVVARAMPLAGAGYLVTFGISPDSPHTGYGYIEAGEEIGDGVFAATRFVEKPDRKAAEAYLSSGDYSWNAGIFLFRADAYLNALGAHAPEVLSACDEAVRAGAWEGKSFHAEATAYARSPSISVDFAVMEKADKVAVAPVEMGWSDIGSWDALYEQLAAAAGENVLDENGLAIDSSGCLIRSDGPTVAVLGVSDLIVIATGDAVLVMPRGESQRVRDVVEALVKKKGGV